MGTFGHFRIRGVAGILLCVGHVVLANYTYDALGRRITFNDPVAGITTRYYYDGQSVIEERNAADVRVRYHVHGSQYIDERLATFITPDQACGLPGRGGGPPASGAFTLHGRPIDVLSDGYTLMHFRARYYDPKHGRWLQRDPGGYADGNDLYEAFGGNAQRFTDPLGNQIETGGLIELDDRSLFEQARSFLTTLLTPEKRIEAAIAGPVGVSQLSARVDALEERLQIISTAAGPVLVRGTAVIGIIGGVVETGTGVIVFVGSQGAGAAPGTIFALHGVDVAQANVRQLISGEFTPTITFESIAGAGYPTTALIVDTGVSLSSGFAPLAVGTATASSARSLSSVARAAPIRAAQPIAESTLVMRFPGVLPSGEANLLNVARRGVLLTEVEASAGIGLVGRTPLAEQRFERILLRPLIEGQQLTGRGVGRLGDLTTRSFTLNEAALAEFFGSKPRFEVFFPATAGSTRGRYLDLLLRDPSGRRQIQFIRLDRGQIPFRELEAARDIQLRSGEPVIFVVTGGR